MSLLPTYLSTWKEISIVKMAENTKVLRTNPTFLYNQDGTVVVKLNKVEKDLRSNREIVVAFRNADIPPAWAADILLDRCPATSSSEFDQFADEEKRIVEEHIAKKVVAISGHEVTRCVLGYSPAATRHKDDATVGIHLRDNEFFLVTGGKAKLEIFSGIYEKTGELIAPREKSTIVEADKDTLMILPKKVQGNRWVYIPEKSEGKFGFEAIYFAYPGPFDASTKREAMIR